MSVIHTAATDFDGVTVKYLAEAMIFWEVFDKQFPKQNCKNNGKCKFVISTSTQFAHSRR